MAEIASAILAFASACYGAARALDRLISDYDHAPDVVLALRSHCTATRMVLKQLTQALNEGALRGVNGNYEALSEYHRYNREFETQLKHFLSELDKFSGCTNSQFTRRPSWGRIRVIWRKQYLEDMRRDILERKSTIQLLIISLQLQTQPATSDLLSAVSLGDESGVNLLLHNGVRPIICRINGVNLSPLHLAAEKESIPLVVLLLNYGADINARNSDGATPLMRAIETKQFSVAEKLIELGADVHNANKEKRTALHIAAGKNLAPVVRLLLKKGADPNSRDSLGETPLNDALRRENREEPAEEVIGILLKHKANPTIGRESSALTPIHIAATNNMVPELSLLAAEAAQAGEERLELSTLIDPCNGYFGETPLWAAARQGHAASVKVLLENRANPSSLCKHPAYPSPLWAAIAAGSLDTAEMLLEQGADPNACDSDGQGILHKAWVEKGEDIVELLIRHNADARIKDRNECEPLHYAIRAGRQRIAELLLDGDACIDAEDNTGATPLMTAAANKNPVLTMFLLHRRAAPHYRNKDGCGAFYCACMKGDVLSAGYILARGGGDDGEGAGLHINRPNKKGNTPLHVAARLGELEMVRWLLFHGANKHLRSTEPFEGFDVAGTAAEVASAAGHLEVAAVIESFEECMSVRTPAWNVGLVT